MKLDIRNVRTRWINLDRDVVKASMMQDLLDSYGFKDHARFKAIEGIKPHHGVRKGEEHYRSCAESHFKLLKKTIIKDSKPVLILEDDVEIEEDAFEPILDVPDAADCAYLGTSHGGYHYQAVGFKNGFTRIRGVLATHAILYLTKPYAKSVIELGKRYIYRKDLPFDVGIASELQDNSRVCARHRPMFYQADAKNKVNKWENITRTPLILSKSL